MSSDSIAIDLALLPDENMVRRARCMNRRMLSDYPAGFALDEQHIPHITLLQAFVLRDDIDTLKSRLQHVGIGDALAVEGFGFHDGGELGAGGFVISRPRWLLKIHQDVLSAVRPFALPDGDASSFVRSAKEVIGRQTVDYVKSYLQHRSGDHYHPHLSVGIAHSTFLQQLQNSGIATFDFQLDGLGLFQLGNFGTCQRLLFYKDAKPNS